MGSANDSLATVELLDAFLGGRMALGEFSLGFGTSWGRAGVRGLPDETLALGEDLFRAVAWCEECEAATAKIVALAAGLRVALQSREADDGKARP